MNNRHPVWKMLSLEEQKRLEDVYSFESDGAIIWSGEGIDMHIFFTDIQALVQQSGINGCGSSVGAFEAFRLYNNRSPLPAWVNVYSEIAEDIFVSASPTSLILKALKIFLLKKHGWKEGTGLGISEQGRLEPVQAYFKKNKRGLGAEKVKKKPQHLENSEHPVSDRKPDKGVGSVVRPANSSLKDWVKVSIVPCWGTLESLDSPSGIPEHLLSPLEIRVSFYLVKDLVNRLLEDNVDFLTSLLYVVNFGGNNFLGEDSLSISLDGEEAEICLISLWSMPLVVLPSFIQDDPTNHILRLSLDFIYHDPRLESALFVQCFYVLVGSWLDYFYSTGYEFCVVL
ncbi:hypothetical protein TEA_001420 [Camellia sinensis var. sinensis]|uniref:G-patch domain-containing protein n=1 Tax=Camellia sinensis var. sinensis TaxID=542762 RepID=A0A4S4CY16_CAMSN|nr:hypothetical protein TEA_001420 [Camellia sinensis var. sinensis]